MNKEEFEKLKPGYHWAKMLGDSKPQIVWKSEESSKLYMIIHSVKVDDVFMPYIVILGPVQPYEEQIPDQYFHSRVAVVLKGAEVGP